MSDAIVVVPNGEVQAYLLAQWCSVVVEAFGCQSGIGAKRPVPDSALNSRRAQHAAEVPLQGLHLPVRRL